MCFKVRPWDNTAETNCSFYKEMEHIILDRIISQIIWFFLFLPHVITFDSLSQDGAIPENSYVNNDLHGEVKLELFANKYQKNNSLMIDIP